MSQLNDNERLQLLLSNTGSALFEIDQKGLILSISDLSLQIFKTENSSEVLHKDFVDCLKPHDPKRIRDFFERTLTGEIVKFEFDRKLAFGDAQQSLQLIPLKNQKGKIESVLAILNDITDLKKTEQMLFTAQKKYRSVIDNIPDLLMEIDTSGHLLFLNRVMPGYSLDQVIGTHVNDYIEDESQKKLFLETLELVLESGQSREYEITTHLKDGRLTYWNSRLTPMFENSKIKRLILLSQDVTDKKRIEKEKQQILEQLFQSQKLESLGKLAGGVAHEFNNLLAIITLHCTLMRNSVKNNSDANQALDIIVKSAGRAEELTAQLLGFARKGKYGAKPIQINPIVKEASSLIQTSFIQNPNLSLKLDLAKNLPSINASESQILQCVMNLGLNAVDAMPDGGQITFRTYTKTEETLLDQNNVACVCLEVADTGMGISPENINRIFDPFFTTKDIGKGTGLGLSMIYGIMENHNGKINVESTPDQGARFTLIFPAL